MPRTILNKNLDNTNFWTHSDLFCLTCDGDGAWEIPNGDWLDWLDCVDCVSTGLEPIPWTELFPNLRRGEPEKYPL